MAVTIRTLALALVGILQLPGNSAGQTANSPPTLSDVFDANGYRIARYRAPVDRLPTPATRIALEKALKLKPGVDALFIDVLPAEGGVRDPATGIWTLASAHETIPGALWHPETGRGQPEVALWHGLHDAVAAVREKSPGMPVVLFCRTDCWMGWNAARRLARDGFGNVLWLAEGIEGWHDAGRALVPARPVVIAP
ncbi:rhodanese-like domain-containing protein [Novosphingobium taihuense]|uniref:PQQ-dependent catabolism-associated CXXCW motif protein n=1 Tax=Novosphingobium taihuense TaxID=260085 RepID=A0A7W7AF75_9SPHN|nr:rhodanese-like domain-containing protein [Novosphingobium taihuense]MBB4614967.1 PQQ-dependent catabolism-associated CXXCW motif protein [Novosphingobium taihuense]TWH84592.1 PQQ-dependent catabolism-associated CXXCW motif protein [Novosphingobium taihuense]